MSIAITGALPPIAAIPAPRKSQGEQQPQAGVEVQKSRFKVPPDQVLVIDSSAEPGEGRVRLEPRQPTAPGSLLDVKY